LLAALTGLAVCAIQLVRAATAAVSALPVEVGATRAALVDRVQAARRDVLARSERLVAALRKDVMAGAGEIRQTADRMANPSEPSLRGDVRIRLFHAGLKPGWCLSERDSIRTPMQYPSA
jgi:hypothetical protein